MTVTKVHDEQYIPNTNPRVLLPPKSPNLRPPSLCRSVGTFVLHLILHLPTAEPEVE